MVLLVAAGLVVIACGGPQAEGDASETVTSVDTAYVAAVATASAPVQDALRGIGEALTQTWPTRDRLYAVLAEAKLSAVADAQVEAIGAIRPPDDQREAHDRLRARADALSEVAHSVDEAVASRDLVAVAMAGADANSIALSSAADLPPHLCAVVEPQAAANGFCAVEGDEADAEYARVVHATAQRLAADFGARAGSLLPAMTPAETSQLLELIQPPIEAALEDARQAFGALEPPARFEADHARLLQYGDETLALARAITAAVSEGDRESLDDLFARSGTVAATAKCDFTAAFHPLVAPVFGFNAPDSC